MRELRRLSKTDGLVVLSTWLRDPAHNQNWTYLSPQVGQHVCFPSLHGFQALCDDAQLCWLASAANIENEQLQVHVTALHPLDITESLRAANFRVFHTSKHPP